ncbi:MAG: DUF2783 domain-containing protein [Alphaproteobacteria bacterium]|nr:DUF2783 domain-containing protein [Alphaproteobacteria bacterium]
MPEAKSTLILTPNIAAPDDTYAALIDAHDGLTDDQSAALNARLISILFNHIGDPAVLAQALRVASQPSQQEERP